MISGQPIKMKAPKIRGFFFEAIFNPNFAAAKFAFG
jgi:hypothetical protein